MSFYFILLSKHGFALFLFSQLSHVLYISISRIGLALDLKAEIIIDV